jgi:uncharacterized protein
VARPPLPPFTQESAAQKARMAEDAWNTRDPARVALAYINPMDYRPEIPLPPLLDVADLVQRFQNINMLH